MKLSKAESLRAHKMKMEAKKRMRQYLHDTTPRRHVFANLSKEHPEYGETPQEQTARMLSKNSS